MRISPTPEQLSYLASIGVPNVGRASPGATVPPPSKTGGNARRSAGTRRSARLWMMVIGILLVVLFLAGLARAQNQRDQASKPALPANESTRPRADVAQRLTALEKEMAALRTAVSHAVTVKQWTEGQSRIEVLECWLASWRDTLLRQIAQDRDRSSQQVESLGVTVRQLQDGLEKMWPQQQTVEELLAFLLSSQETAEARAAQTQRTQENFVSTSIESLRDDLDARVRASERRQAWFALIGLLALGLLTTVGFLLTTHVRQLEQAMIAGLGGPWTGAGSPGWAAAPAPNATVVHQSAQGKKTGAEPVRLGRKPPPSPEEQMRAIINSAEKVGHLRAKPKLSAGPWRLGLATIKGNVRSENQDYGLCFQIDRRDVMIVADGCGGIPNGQRAAHIAVVSAAAALVYIYGRTPRWRCPRAQAAAARAIRNAAHCLAVEGDRLNVTDIRGGLRTTLIVVVGEPREIGYAFIGDGGGYILHPTGRVERFLQPQKADALAMNVLAASLGPVMEGDPVTGVRKRSAGDLVIVGSDGVFDRVEESFPCDVLRGCIQYNGDLQRAADHIVQELASFQDPAGYVCDDNLTLGIMGSGTAPQLPPGFWSAFPEGARESTEVPAAGAIAR